MALKYSQYLTIRTITAGTASFQYGSERPPFSEPPRRSEQLPHFGWAAGATRGERGWGNRLAGRDIGSHSLDLHNRQPLSHRSRMTVRTEAAVLLQPTDEALRHLPEGPYPLGPSRLSWVAIQHGPEAKTGSLNVLDLTTGVNQSYTLPGRPGFAFPCDDGRRFVIGCERRLGIFNPSNGDWQPFGEEIDTDVSGTIINDGVIFEDNLIFGTKDLEFATRKAGLYLYRGRDRKLIRLRDDQICSNGKAIRQGADGLELIDIDTPTLKIVAYPLDIAAARIGSPRTIIDLTGSQSFPDGAILSPAGDSIIVSMYNPSAAPEGETREYSLVDGGLRRVWATPGSPRNTCPNLIHHNDRVHLVITTAVEGMPADQRRDSPNAGCLFHAETEFDSTGNAPSFPASP